MPESFTMLNRKAVLSRVNKPAKTGKRFDLRAGFSNPINNIALFCLFRRLICRRGTMIGFESGARKFLLLVSLLGLPLMAQQNVPDAPQPKTPQPSQFPDNAPAAPKNQHPELPPPGAASTPEATPVPQEGGVATSRNDLFTYSVRVNFVQVPVTVKDSSGRLVAGLGPKDFAVYEDGKRQQLTLLTSDPFPLSAAVVVDTDLPSTTMKKINDTLPALIGAFSQFDEVALYRYGHTVQEVTNFSGADNVSTASLIKVKRPGREGGPPMIGG